MTINTLHQPLNGIRILDICEGTGDMCGRYLADLGAEVILVEPPGGSKARSKPPIINENSSCFATRNANKKSLVLDADLEEDQTFFRRLAAVSDIVIYDRTPHFLRWSASIDAVKASDNSQLISLSISEFGDNGPYGDYTATNAVHMAMTGVLARSGIKGRDPLLPPGEMAYMSAPIQASWVALLAYWQRLQTGAGGHMDFSIFEACCQILDPALGVTGSAAGGQSATKMAPRGRPPIGKLYPFFRCANGYVRICVLNPRQWVAMSEWLGDDHPYTDPSFGKLAKRFKHMRDINALIEAKFAPVNAKELVEEGQRRGVPMAAVATPEDVLNDVHFAARGAFVNLTWANGQTGKAPSGYLEIDDQRMGIRTAAPELGADSADIKALIEAQTATTDNAAQTATKENTRQPLEGIRVLDLGVIVAGAELGRLFADQGAEVIKIENKAFPDGLRQSFDHAEMTDSFAQGSRGKKSLGLNLRSEEGKRLFKALVAKSDIVMSNFKPGTMESLGFGYPELKAINPRIIVSESSALGNSGPLSKAMGYGPMVRASTGLAGLWSYPGQEASFADAITILPDHLAARVAAVAILALLIDREKTGVGAKVCLSQAETILMMLSSELLSESLQPGSLQATGNIGQFDTPANIFPCQGEDEWCAIEISNTDEWHTLCAAIGRADLADHPAYQSSAGRLEHRDLIESEITQWTQSVSPHAATTLLQQAGIAAGFMQRVHELADDPHLQARAFFRYNNQPGLSEPLLTENGPVGRSHLPEPVIKPAPYVAENTREVMRSILSLSDDEIDALIASGDIEVRDTAAADA